MRVGFVPLFVLALGGCSLFLATDDLSGDQSGADGGDASSGGADGSSSGDGGGGDGGAIAIKRGPLVFIQSADNWKTRVDGFFELTFRDSKWKHPVEWLDLSVGNSNLAGSAPFYQPPRAKIDGSYNDDGAASPGEWGAVDLLDFSPVGVAFTTYLHHPQSGGRDLKRWARFTIHATGRIVVESWIANPNAAALAIDEFTYHDVDVTPSVGWDITDLPNGSAAGFFSRSTSSSFAIVNQAGETSLGGSATHRAWKAAGVVLNQNEEQKRFGEIQLGVTKTDFQERVEDIRNPAVEVLEGGVGASSGFDQDGGFYVVTASTGTLKFGLGPTRARYYPSFVISGLAGVSATWKVSIDGRVIASAQQPVTSDAVAKYIPTDGVLLLAYFGVIPQNASAASRTFVIER